MKLLACLAALAAFLAGSAAAAQSGYAERLKEGDVTFRNFKFQSGEILPQLRMHYATLGSPRRDAGGRIVNAVMVLHGTGGSGRQFLQPQFADELFGPGQPLDIGRYFIILPDNIGHGKSSKPSDGMRAKFPRYDYDDMVEAQRRMLVEGLGVRQLRLLMGTSMGCMHGFVWAEKHPDFSQAMMPMACLPTQIAGHNRMWRKAAVEGIRQDPAWLGGNYQSQPVQGLRTAVSLLQIVGFAPLYL
ncbi:MAG: alpha/beta fold hydrolase, partial [Pseudomonadota bacterium]|nr:alpha/beta fold hydrolase [Pseudomonadota bacterium]